MQVSPESPSDVRGHGHICFSPHPWQPWPRGAVGQPRRGRSLLPDAAACNLKSHGPRPRRKQNPAEPSGTRGSRFWKVWSLKLPLSLRNIVVLRCLEVIQLVETHVAFGIIRFGIPLQTVSAVLPIQMTWKDSNTNREPEKEFLSLVHVHAFLVLRKSRINGIQYHC